MYKIDTHIPIPESVASGRRGRPTTYPFTEMSVGDSFFVPFGDEPEKTVANRVHSAVAQFHRRGTNSTRRLALRTEALGVRVWRIA
jgi:hypothetical protein